MAIAKIPGYRLYQSQSATLGSSKQPLNKGEHRRARDEKREWTFLRHGSAAIPFVESSTIIPGKDRTTRL